jgi:hypothetical protein
VRVAIVGSIVAGALFLVFGTGTARPTAATLSVVPPSRAQPVGVYGAPYYSLRRDFRRCAFPLCGGYFVRRVNQSSTRCADGGFKNECYVAEIAWSGQRELEPDAGHPVVVRGTIELKNFASSVLGLLRVSESWQAFGGSGSLSGAVYLVHARGIRCPASPCLTHREEKLNSTLAANIAGVDLSAVASTPAELNKAVAAIASADGALVVGTHSTVTGPAGTAMTLHATLLFVRARLAGAAPSASAPTLLENGSAELGPAVTTDSGVTRTIPAWVQKGNFTVVQYGSPGGFPDAAVSKAIRGGKKFFAGGPANPSSGATQVVNVATRVVAIDAGKLTATLAGYLGGFSGQRDSLTVTATFRDVSGNKLGGITIGPVTPAQRGNNTTMLAKSATAKLPAKTRSIEVALHAVRTDGSYNDGYADNLSLTLATGA